MSERPYSELRGVSGMRRSTRQLMGTLMEVGAPVGHESAFEAILEAQTELCCNDPRSDIARFNAMPSGREMRVGLHTAAVLTASRHLQADGDGLFDISRGSGVDGWCLRGSRLVKLISAVTLDPVGIAKGYAVDLAVLALKERGVSTGWVKAGGVMRVFGEVELPLQFCDERTGHTREFARLRDGAFATNQYRAQSVTGQPLEGPTRFSVATPLCLWAEALTQVVGLTGRLDHPLVASCDAVAWRHDVGSIQT